MKISEQIRKLLADRALVLRSLETLSAACVTKDGDVESIRRFTADEQTKFDAGKVEIEAIDKQIGDLKSMESMIASQSEVAPAPAGPGAVVAPPAPTPGVAVVPFKPFKGQAFTRLANVLVSARGNLAVADAMSKKWEHQTPEVNRIIRAAMMVGTMNDPVWLLGKAAVAVGTTIDPAWAGPLVDYTTASGEFLELLRPATIVDRIQGMRRVPFMTRMPSQTAGSTGNWVGEGLSKPVSALAFSDLLFPFAKMATIVVMTQELIRMSTPSAEALVRDDIVKGLAAFKDSQFLDPTVAPLANVRPGSVTNGVTAIPSSGSTVADVTADLAAATLAITNANVPLVNPVWIMTPTALNFLMTLRTAQDVFAYRDELQGGTLLGYPVITTTSPALPVVGGLSSIILIEASQIAYADDGDVTLDASDQASLQMDSAPATPPTPLVSLWQQNLIAIKGEQYAYWMRLRDVAVQIITGFPAA